MRFEGLSCMGDMSGISWLICLILFEHESRFDRRRLGSVIGFFFIATGGGAFFFFSFGACF